MSKPLLALSALALGAAAPVAKPLATTDTGQVAGRRDGATYAFLGIPFAASTAGANRWRAPQPVTPWRGVRDAQAFGPNCVQGPPYDPPGGSPWTPEYMPVGPSSEDCLSLNIWTPKTRAGAKLPVMVWIHGGGFAGGSSTVPLYRGANLATRGIVVVTINYRLGVFGFLAHPALTAEAGSSGNYGLMDQIAALRWVKRNIANFGGDPERVTIAGQSAGAASVHDLLAAPAAQGLFVRAIAESGSGMGIGEPPLQEAEAMGERLARVAHAPTLAALRAASPETLLAASNDPAIGPPGPKFRPVQEPAVLPNPAAQRGDVPVLTGLAADETSVGEPAWRSADAAVLAKLLSARFGPQAARFAPLYGGDPGVAARTLLSDRGTAAMLFWSEKRPAGAAPVYAYFWTHPEPFAKGRAFGAFHSAELPYVFGNLDAPNRPFVAADRQLSETTMRYWTNFIVTGDPNGAGLPAWPTADTGKLLEIGGRIAARPALDPRRLATYRAYVEAGGTLGLF